MSEHQNCILVPGAAGTADKLLVDLDAGIDLAGPVRSNIYRLTLVKGDAARLIILPARTPPLDRPFELDEVNESRDIVLRGGEQLFAQSTQNTYTVCFEFVK